MRRAFLKGIGQERGCRYPARAATREIWDQRVAALEAAKSDKSRKDEDSSREVADAAAAEVAAQDVSGEARRVLRALAASARVGTVTPSETGLPGQVATAWSLSQRHGLPLAELLDAVRRDFVARTRFVRRADANMAGPRASAAVLATLPGVGILLGEGMGARPLHVLATTGAGHMLLLLGAGLILGGVVWSVRLTKLVVGP